MPLHGPVSPAATAVTSNTSSSSSITTPTKTTTTTPTKTSRSLPAFRYHHSSGTGKSGSSSSSRRGRFHEDSYADYANDDAEDYNYNSHNYSSVTNGEVGGMDLLRNQEAVQELHKQRHLMTFNAVQLLKKQRGWLEGVKGTSKTVIELENLERKIDWFMENKRQKKDNDPLTPSKALFRAMTMLDSSMEKIQKAHGDEVAKAEEESHDLRRANASLQARNSALLEATAGLQKERDALRLELQEEKKKSSEAAAAASAAAASVAATPREVAVDGDVSAVSDDEEEEVAGPAAEIGVGSPAQDGAVRPSSPSPTSPSPTGQAVGDDAAVPAAGASAAVLLGDDLGSRWHTLEESEEATAHVASLESQVCQLSALVAEKTGAIENLRGEWQHMRLQLGKLEESRLEAKRECEAKESALAVAASRIASLEDEVLQTHARCATSEEDYDALKESFTTQKEATRTEIAKAQEECCRRIDEIRTECERLLEASNEAGNALKAAVEELKGEREDLREICAGQDEKIKRIGEMLRANLKAGADGGGGMSGDEEEDVSIRRSAVDEVFNEFDGYDLAAAGGGSGADRKEGEEKDDQTTKSFEMAHDRFKVGRKLAERASMQASTIADLQDANEIKDAQLQALHEMVESLLVERGENVDNRQWGHRIQKWKEGRK